MTQPSIIMPWPRSLVRTSCAGMARRSASVFIPSFSAACTVRCSAASRVSILVMPRPIQAPLSEMPRRNRPFASGEPVRPATMQAPADWPKIVTSSGSPPKAAMLALIHFSTVMESIRA